VWGVKTKFALREIPICRRNGNFETLHGSVHHRFEPVNLAELVTQVGPVPFGPTVPESA
jgi:hypothetical protein